MAEGRLQGGSQETRQRESKSEITFQQKRLHRGAFYLLSSEMMRRRVLGLK